MIYADTALVKIITFNFSIYLKFYEFINKIHKLFLIPLDMIYFIKNGLTLLSIDLFLMKISFTNPVAIYTS
jgi:hypothetical protein